MTQYINWIDSLFNRSEESGDWRWNINSVPQELSDYRSVEYFIQLTNDLPILVNKYSKWQISLGLEYLLNFGMSHFSEAICNGSSPIEQRIEAILGIKKIYTHVFEPLCEQRLGHLSEVGNDLNIFCYMLWDTTPLGVFENNVHSKELYAAVTEVMRYALESTNIACVESGLHGIGETVWFYPECSKIARDFIETGKCTDDRLMKYAQDAELGNIH